MNQHVTLDGYGTLIEPTTLKIERLLPGPIERVWEYLTKSDLRRQWLAAGDMELALDAPFELTWRNDTLTDPPGQRPEGFGAEHSMQSRITELDPPRKLAFTFGNVGDVSFELAPRGERVLLTLIHNRVAERSMRLNVSAGWHAHLDILAARLAGTKAEPFWDSIVRLKGDYDSMLPA